MIDDFFLMFEGKFENRTQAFSYPSKYAYIRVTHVNIGDGLFYGEQAYKHELHLPYRQFVLEPILENDYIRVKNYKIDDKKRYVNFSNLDKIEKNMLKYKNGCDLIFKQQESFFVGELVGCDCIVDWDSKKTYVQTKIELTKEHYYIMDKGYCANDHTQLWGSNYDQFEFIRMPE